jgi:DNA-binding Lrp family transcriptional regulator
MDASDRKILALLVQDGRRTYDDIARHVALSSPAVKRRVDRLRARGALRGFTAVIDHAALGDQTEALIELFFAPGTLLDTVAETLRQYPEVVEAWSVTGEADAIARVRTRDNADLERLIMELQQLEDPRAAQSGEPGGRVGGTRGGLVQRTRSQVVLSALVSQPGGGVGT